MTESVTAYIGIGSNEGDREGYCGRAVDLLCEAGRVTAVSSFYDTAPVGDQDQRDFVNAAAAVETDLSPDELLRVCRSIEERLGRKRTRRWGPRTVDLDILLYDDLVLSTPELEVPHPRMAERLFVLAPLAEIAPSVVHPVLKRTMEQLRDAVPDQRAVRRGAKTKE